MRKSIKNEIIDDARFILRCYLRKQEQQFKEKGSQEPSRDDKKRAIEQAIEEYQNAFLKAKSVFELTREELNGFKYFCSSIDASLSDTDKILQALEN